MWKKELKFIPLSSVSSLFRSHIREPMRITSGIQDSESIKYFSSNSIFVLVEF